MQDIFISVVIPCHNTADHIVKAINSTQVVLARNYNYFEIIIVDDGSNDDTTGKINNLLRATGGLRLLRMAQTNGTDAAVAVGLDSAIGDFVVIMDPLIDPPEIIPQLVTDCLRNPGIYYGIPTPARHHNWLRRVASKIFDWYCRKYLHIDIQRNSLLFRVFPRSAVNAFTQLTDKTRILKLITANLGMPVYFFNYNPQTRTRGTVPRRTLGDDINLAFDILVATSRHPLRLVSRLGLMLAGTNIIYAFYIVAIFLFKENVAEGWVTLSMQNAVMFFALFTLLALLGEYIGKAVLDDASRPIFTAIEERNSSVLVDENQRRNIITHTTENQKT